MSTSSEDAPPPGDEQSNASKSLRIAGPLFGSGIQLAVSAVLMFFIGRWLDEKYNTAPWIMFGGLLFGSAAGLYHFIKTANEVSRKELEQKKNTV